MVASIADKPFPFYYPRTGWSPVHACYRKAAVYYPVNSSGNLFFELTPSIYAGNSSDASNTSCVGLIVLNNVGYSNININTYNFSAGGGLTDTTLNRQLGIALSPNIKWGICIGATIQVAVTGVSNLNRSGVLNFVEYSDNQFPYLDNAASNSYTQISNYMNARPYASMIQYPRHAEYELSSSNDQIYTYTWLPNFSPYEYDSYSTDYAYINTLGAIPALIPNNTAADYKKIALYASGLPTTAILRIDITLVYNAMPSPGFMNQYPCEDIVDKTDVTSNLMTYGSQNSFIFTSGKTNHNHGYYIPPTLDLDRITNNLNVSGPSNQLKWYSKIGRTPTGQRFEII